MQEGSDPRAKGPVIVLVEPQLGENIGMVARAMANFGLDEMRLVNPRAQTNSGFHPFEGRYTLTTRVKAETRTEIFPASLQSMARPVPPRACAARASKRKD